jgi:menaquinone-dependent protoporphyrinogen oxidase
MTAADPSPTGTASPVAVRAPRVLVAYATRFGSTRGVAERIAAQLRRAGCNVELHSCDTAAGIGSYDAVILGSAVFNQRWLAEADQFSRVNRDVLASRPVWLFTVGTFGDTKRIIGGLMRREPRDIRVLQDTIHPRDYRVFAGVIDRHQWPLGSRLFYHALGGRLGDNRDWPAIDEWATEIARALGR